jgi:hypothetical protein
MKLLDLLKEIKAKPGPWFKVDPDKALQMFLDEMAFWNRTQKDKKFKLIGYKEYNRENVDRENQNFLLYFFLIEGTEEVVKVILRGNLTTDVYEYFAEDFIELDDFERKTNIIKINEIKVKPATQPKVDPDKVLEYYIEDLKNHLRSRTDGSKMWRLAKRPQVFDPKNYKLINYTEHFNSSYSGFPNDYIAYYFKYKFTGEIKVVVLHKGRPGQADDNLQISDDYWYYRFTDVDNFNRRINEIKVKPSQPSLLKLIEDNLDFIKRKLDIKIIHSIELISDNPQEVEIQATVIGGYNEFDDEYDAEVGFLFRFLEDAENDEEFISDYGQDPGLEFMIITLDGLKIAVIELEIND